MSIFNANENLPPLIPTQLSHEMRQQSCTSGPANASSNAGGTKAAAKKALIQLVRDQQKRSFSESAAVSLLKIPGEIETATTSFFSSEIVQVDAKAETHKKQCNSLLLLMEQPDSSISVSSIMRIESLVEAVPAPVSSTIMASALSPELQWAMGLESHILTPLSIPQNPDVAAQLLFGDAKLPAHSLPNAHVLPALHTGTLCVNNEAMILHSDDYQPIEERIRTNDLDTEDFYCLDVGFEMFDHFDASSADEDLQDRAAILFEPGTELHRDITEDFSNIDSFEDFDVDDAYFDDLPAITEPENAQETNLDSSNFDDFDVDGTYFSFSPST